MSFKIHLANYVLENTKLSTMPDAAVQALIEGFDSPSLTKLAGESGDHSNLMETFDPSKIHTQNDLEECLRHASSGGKFRRRAFCYLLQRLREWLE
jgi:hypothetical protein